MIAPLYSPLNIQRLEIRLLHLLPGSETEEISCELEQVSLQNMPVYEALSYVWGDASNKVPIQLNGCSFHITQNLHSALRGLRWTGEKRVLWVDAVCINQNDIPERSHQVSIMDKIYPAAAEVCVWLGDLSSSQVGPVAGLFEFLRFWAKENRHISAMFSGVEDARWGYISKGFSILVKSAWWKRIWVLQEILLATSATLYLGPWSCSWKEIYDACNCYYHHRAFCCRGVFFPGVAIQWGNLMEETTRNDINTTLYEAMDSMRVSERRATDPRDYVYGLLGVVKDEGLIPDYSLSVEQVYARTTEQIIRETNTLDILCFRNNDCALDLPSWVPDWRVRVHGDVYSYSFHDEALLVRLQHYHFSGVGVGTSHVYDDKILSVQGLQLNTVLHVGELMTYDSAVSSLSTVLKSWQYLVHSVFAGDNRGDAEFWETMAGDHAHLPQSTTEKQRIWRPVMEGDRRELQHWWHTVVPSLDQHTRVPSKEIRSSPIVEASMIFTHAKRFFRSDVGLMGMGPGQMRVGDEIFALAGGRMPFIMRPVEERVTTSDRSGEKVVPSYNLIGPCYIRGIMHEEILRYHERPLSDVFIA